MNETGAQDWDIELKMNFVSINGMQINTGNMKASAAALRRRRFKWQSADDTGSEET